MIIIQYSIFDFQVKSQYCILEENLTKETLHATLYLVVYYEHNSTCNDLKSLLLQLDTAHDPGRLAEGLRSPHFLLFPWCKLCGPLPSTHWFLEPSICWLASLKDPEKHSYTTWIVSGSLVMYIVVLWLFICWFQALFSAYSYGSATILISVNGIIMLSKKNGQSLMNML